MSKQLKSKIFISGKIEAETGLHIGGSKSSLDIGGVDLNVIKTPNGEPFIPGSSLKGKLRSMLARTEGSEAVNIRELEKDKEGKSIGIADEHFNYLNQLFGLSGDDQDGKNKGEVTRVIVRDAPLDTDGFTKKFADAQGDMDFEYSVVKWENTIDRRKGTAEYPRQLERVPAGAMFNFEIVYDLYDDAQKPYEHNKDKNERPDSRKTVEKHAWALLVAMQLLQDDYLGGQGSRGYGKIRFAEVNISQKNINLEKGLYEEAPEVDKAFQIFNNAFKTD